MVHANVVWRFVICLLIFLFWLIWPYKFILQLYSVMIDYFEVLKLLFVSLFIVFNECIFRRFLYFLETCIERCRRPINSNLKQFCKLHRSRQKLLYFSKSTKFLCGLITFRIISVSQGNHDIYGFFELRLSDDTNFYLLSKDYNFLNLIRQSPISL